MSTELQLCKDYIDTIPLVIQYRLAYFESRGNIPPNLGLPTARTYPRKDYNMSYRDKLINLLNLPSKKGVEIGPLNVPLISRKESNILYVDHLNTEGLKKKYPTLENIVDIDRPLINNDLEETLRKDLPVDYVMAVEVFEHLANPIFWLKQVSKVLNVGGLLALSIPD